MKAKPLTPYRTEPESVRCTVALEFTAVLTGRVGELGATHEKFDAAVRELYSACERDGVQIVTANGAMRPLSQEEILRLVPRKWHMEENGRQLCDTPFVSPKFLTKETARITCKLCLKRMHA